MGSVATMSLPTTTILRRTSANLAAHAFMATTTQWALTEPPEVRTTGRAGGIRSSAVISERSKMRTPRSRATRRSPRASRAGWTIAPVASTAPPR